MNYFEKPPAAEHTAYVGRYVSLVPENHVYDALQNGVNRTLDFFALLPDEKWSYRYAEGKWDIHEILGHMIDTERVFAYRALSFARGDAQHLPGYEENDFAANSNASRRAPSDLMQEYTNLRLSTLDLFKSFDPEVLARTGTANENVNSVRAIGYLLAGHEIHHMNIIRERYL
jgi:uncharacterized damage-inducible protein DinB